MLYYWRIDDKTNSSAILASIMLLAECGLLQFPLKSAVEFGVLRQEQLEIELMIGLGRVAFDFCESNENLEVERNEALI